VDSMTPPDDSNRELNTWAEIAAYLGVTPRTAQIWRKDGGLPVRKLGGRVVANTGELDRWKASMEVEAAVSTAPAEPARANRALRPHLLAALAVAGLIVFFTGAWWFTTKAEGGHRVVRFVTEGNSLVAYDDRAERAWTHHFKHPLDHPPATHSFRSLFAEIDDDGQAELLFVPWSGGKAKGLYCFRSGGQLAWMAPFGRTVTDSLGVAIPPDYAPTKLLVLRKPRKDGGRIVVLSQHRSAWPTQISVWTPQGQRVAEYWHAGPLWEMASADLDRDGVEELVFGGMNLSCRRSGPAAILLVLDSEFPSGQGPYSMERPLILGEAPSVVPAAALTFLHPPGDGAGASHGSAIDQIRWNGEHLDIRQRASAPEFDVHYRLTRHLELVGATFAHHVVTRPGQARKALTDQVASGIEVLQNRFTSGRTERKSSETGNRVVGSFEASESEQR
jgi:hypothetical protein